MENNEMIRQELFPTIHPAIDFIEEHAYVGQIVHTGRREWGIHLLRDDSEVIPEDTDDLMHSEYKTLVLGLWKGSRWSERAATTFVNRQTPETSRTQLLTTIVEQLRAYIELPDERLYDFLALWNIGTYFFPLFNSYPYVHVGGITGSGKSKLLRLCSCLSFNSILSANMSTAVIYRAIECTRSTLFIDEAGNLQDQDRGAEFRNILYSGYTNGARVFRNIRTAEGNFRPEAFDVYGPKMIANIEGLEEILNSRCIGIIMRRGANRQIVNRDVGITDPVWQQIRDMLYPFLMQNWRGISQAYSDMQNDEDLNGRDWELWRSILSLARFFDNNTLYPHMRDLAVEIAAQRQIDTRELHESVLIETLLPIVTNDGYYSLNRIRRAMAENFRDDSWLTERYLGRLLRNLRFLNRRRMRAGFEYFISATDLRELAQRYGIGVDGAHGEHATGQGTQDNQNQGDNTNDTG